VKPQTIWDDDRTLLAQALAYEGFSYAVIQRECDLSVGQTSYRLRKLGVSPTEYRTGDSEQSQEKLRKLRRKFLQPARAGRQM
jgi:hypothetical protein